MLEVNEKEKQQMQEVQEGAAEVMAAVCGGQMFFMFSVVAVTDGKTGTYFRSNLSVGSEADIKKMSDDDWRFVRDEIDRQTVKQIDCFKRM